jgi:tetratricopeptide (TPR) repeat protein
MLRSHRRLHAARRCFECSRSLQTSHDPRSESIWFHEIGLLYRDESNTDQAIECLKESRRIKQTFDDRHGMGLSEMELGHIYLKKGDQKEASIHFEDARRFLTPGFAGLTELEKFLEKRTNGSAMSDNELST